jgi:small GTP-binding protein
LYSFISNQSKIEYLPTVGMEYYPVTYKLSDGNVINVHIHDTCGQERFNAITESYYKKGDGILLVFDITSQKSFDKIKDYYVANIREKCKKNIPIILLGNKTDLDDKRVVSQEEAIDLAVNEEFVYKETSCLKNENVADAFETIIEIWNINNKQIIKNKTATPENENKIKEIYGEEQDEYTNDKDTSFSLSSRTNSYASVNIDNKKRKKKFC